MGFKEFGCIGSGECAEIIPIIVHLLQRLINVNNQGNELNRNSWSGYKSVIE